MQTPLSKEQAERVGEAFATFAELGLLSVDLNNHVTLNTPPHDGQFTFGVRTRAGIIPMNAAMIRDNDGYWREVRGGERTDGWFAGFEPSGVCKVVMRSGEEPPEAAAAVGVAPAAARTEHVDARSRVFIPGGEVVVPRAQDAKLPALNAALVFDELGWREAKDGETPTGWFAGGSGDTEIRVKLRNTAPPYDDSRSDDAMDARLEAHSERIALMSARLDKVEASHAYMPADEFTQMAHVFNTLQKEFAPEASVYTVARRGELLRDKLNGQVNGLDLARLTAMAKIEKHLFPNSSCTAESATITANQVCRLLPFDMGFGG